MEATDVGGITGKRPNEEEDGTEENPPKRPRTRKGTNKGTKGTKVKALK